MAFSERQKLAEEIIFLSEKRGITANDLHACDGCGFRITKLHIISNILKKRNI
jgi:hypothetical protein